MIRIIEILKNKYFKTALLNLTSPFCSFCTKCRFLSDKDTAFEYWVDDLKKKAIKKAIILGNAPSLNELSEEKLKDLKEKGFLSIGINRSIYKYETDVLAWSDLKALQDILKYKVYKNRRTTFLNIRLERKYHLPLEHDIAFKNLYRYWSKNKNFRSWKSSKLFMFRNTLVAVLHLCYKLEIKEIVLVGFNFDNRKYFYDSNIYNTSQKYELRDSRTIKSCFGGYDTQKIVQEVLEYLINDEKFNIKYSGQSNFLNQINGLQNVSLGDI